MEDKNKGGISMIGYKLYYEKLTGDVILTIPEKHNKNATQTSKTQDFAMYDVLQARNPEEIEVLELGYGEHRGSFQSANSWSVDLNTKTLVFDYPKYVPPLTTQVETLENKNEQLTVDSAKLNEQVTIREFENIDTMIALTEAYEKIIELEIRLLALEGK